ncbi:CBS domain-containing protein [Streptomyces beijiangensis]|uniref:CBS domain-containing protein n=1 Tax=Streptomyces beijiangensis TaxID=163361 RepID=A0A939F6L9_9ACTN|nr:CBS domain-containing protein [Streptomyces beijiangensis]MBO0513295.1 CBS domain-containing protein [Streptomyces beijiangensis]
MRHSKIGSVMTGDVVCAEFGTPFKEVARLLAEHKISGLPVVDGDERVMGVVSGTDLMRDQARTALSPQPSLRPRLRLLPKGRSQWDRNVSVREHSAGQLMSRPAVTIHADDTVAVGARTMAQHGIERLPVVDDEDRLVGIVTRRDLLQLFLRPDADLHREVVESVLGGALRLPLTAVSVDVQDGVVMLKGEVERRIEATVAQRMAQQIDGVIDVVSELTWRIDDSVGEAVEEQLQDVADAWIHKL